MSFSWRPPPLSGGTALAIRAMLKTNQMVWLLSIIKYNVPGILNLNRLRIACFQKLFTFLRAFPVARSIERDLNLSECRPKPSVLLKCKCEGCPSLHALRYAPYPQVALESKSPLCYHSICIFLTKGLKTSLNSIAKGAAHSIISVSVCSSSSIVPSPAM